MMLLRCTILLLAVNIVSSINTTSTYTTEGTTTATVTPSSVFDTYNNTDAGTATELEASNATSQFDHRNGTFIVPQPKLIDEDRGFGVDVIFGETSDSNETETDEEELGSGISNAANVNGSRTGDSSPKAQGEHPNKIVPSSRTDLPSHVPSSSTEGIIIIGDVILAGHGLNPPSAPPNRDRDGPGGFFGTTDVPLPGPVPKKSSSGNLVVIIPLVCLGFVLLVLVVVLHCQNTRERRRVRQLKVMMRRDARMSARSTDPLWRSDRSCTSRGGRSSTSRGARSARSQRSQRSYELKELPHCAECHHGVTLHKQQLTNGYPGGKSCNVPVTARSDPNILGHRGMKGPVEYFLDDELYKASLTPFHRKTQSEPTRLNAHMAYDAEVDSPFQRVPNNSPAGSCPTTPHPRYINVTEPDNHGHLLAASLSGLDAKWTDNRLYVPPDNDPLAGGPLPLHLFANRDIYQDLNSNSIQSSMGPGLDSDFGASAGLSLRIMSSDSSITGYPTTYSGNTGEVLSTESSLTSTITATPASSCSTAWVSQGDTRLYQTRLEGWDNQAQMPLLSSEEHWV